MEAPPAGSLRLRARARARSESDAVERAIPVLPRGVERAVVASGAVGESWTATLAVPAGAEGREQELEVVVDAPGAGAIRRALGYLARYPYGCVEQTMSRFLPAVIALEAMDRAGIEDAALRRELPRLIDHGLQRLYGFQHEDGGWGWWSHDTTDRWMTAYVLYGLAVSRRAGVAADDLALERGFQALEDHGTVPLGVLASVLAGRPLADPTLPEARSFTDRAYLVLAGRLDLAAGLPELEEGAASKPRDVLETALAIRVLHHADPRDPRIDELVARLLYARRGDAWRSTLETGWAIQALATVVDGSAEPRWTVEVDGRDVPQAEGHAVVPASALAGGPYEVRVRRVDAPVQSGQPLFASAVLRYLSDPPPQGWSAGPFTLERRIERLEAAEGGPRWAALESGAVVRVGDPLRVLIGLRAREATGYLLLENPIPAGCEAAEGSGPPEELELDCEFARVEYRDDRVAAAVAGLYPGEARWLVHALHPVFPGTYHVRPARVFDMYRPDLESTTGGFVLRIADREPARR